MTARNTDLESPALPLVLVVTDDPDAAKLWNALFREKGWMALSETSAGALQAGHIPNAWLALVDVNIAHAERLALCRALKSVGRVAVLMLIPSRPQEIAESYAAGADECIVQPANPALVMVKVMAWMVRQQLMGSNSLALEAFA